MIYPIRCSHCMSTFNHDDVHFRASHYKEWIKDPLPKIIDGSGVIDEKLNQYYKRIHSDQDARLKKAIDTKSAAIQKNYSEEGMLIGIVDDFKEPTTQRLCPNCHNDIPEFSGRLPHFFIALIGETSVGKTVYMSALAATLFPGDAKDNHVGVSIKPADLKTLNWFKSVYTKMFEKQLLPSSTQRERIEPIHLNIGNKAIVSIYDAAGEGIRRLEDRKSYLVHLQNSDGYIILVDPYETTMRARVKDIHGEVTTQKDEHIIENNIRWMLPELSTTDDVKTEKPVAITLSKSDLLKSLLIDSSTLHSNSTLYTQSSHREFLNLSMIDTIDYEVTKLLKASYSQFITVIQGYLSNYKCFAVSSIGLDTHISSSDQNVYTLSCRPRPLRVEEPILWILYKLDLIKGSSPSLQRPNILNRIFG